MEEILKQNIDPEDQMVIDFAKSLPSIGYIENGHLVVPKEFLDELNTTLESS